MDKTGIEWTESTINFFMGCRKVSEGCRFCYMFRNERRWGKDPTQLRRTNWKNIERKLKNWTPRTIFANSMTDMFIEDLTIDQIKEMFDVMEKYPQHNFQILTKRSKRLPEYSKKYQIPNNVWLGVSVELDKYQYRIDDLRKSNAITKFISFEPLLGKINNPNLQGIDWVIVGGESDFNQPRKMEEEWVQRLLRDSKKHNIPFFFKQWGGRTKCQCHKAWGCRLLNNKTYDELPENKHLNELQCFDVT